MTRRPLNRVLNELQRTIEPADSGESDARLMERFTAQGDGQSFASLVRRHGPMVYGVCRRVLGNVADAEDVFQATFLVLLRKARSLRRTASVGNWLYGVAYRTALEARRAMARRRVKEAQARSRVASADHAALNELRAVLDAELARLPERYRQVIVLCDLEGQGRKQAARCIGCPEGTVASRLAKARSLLASRLNRHGLGFSAAAVAAALAAEAASAAVPAAWLPATVMAARQFAGATAGAVSTKVVSLVQGVCRTMLVKKLTTIGAVLLVAALAGFGAGTVYFQTATAGALGDEQGDNAAPQTKPHGDRAELRRLKEDLHQLQNKAAALKAHIAELERETPEMLYHGKPASDWIRQLRDRDPKFREEALIALGGIAQVDASLIPTILAALRDREAGVCTTAAAQLADDIGQPALPLLTAGLKDANQDYRIWVIATIIRFQDEARPAVPALTALLKSGTQNDRIAAAEVLGCIGPGAAPAVPALMELLKDRSPLSRYVAALALGRIGPNAKSAVPLLIPVLDDTEPYVLPKNRSLEPLFRTFHHVIPAAAAAHALGDIGPAAKAARPALQSVLVRNPCHDVTTAVTEALSKIGEAPKSPK